MTSRERVKTSLNHSQPDKIPIDFGSTVVTGMHVSIVSALRDHFGLEKKLVKAYEPYQMLGLIEPDLQEVLGVDFEGVVPRETMFGFPNEKWKPWKMPNGFEVLVSEHFYTTGDNGDVLIYPKGDKSAQPSGRMPETGYFFDSIVRQNPIVENELDPKDNLEEFDLISEADLQYFNDEFMRASQTDRAVMVTIGGTAFGDIALVPAPFLKNPKGIRDIEEWYMSTLMRQDYIHQVFEKQSEIALSNLDKLAGKIGDKVDVVFICGTDFGTQTSTFCSEDLYRNLYMPYYKKINGWIHSNTKWKTFKHSCGAVHSFIPAFIESGFDILNPVQCSATNMNPADLKNKFGKDIVFWGGGVDNQTTLAFGTPDEVYKQVIDRCEIFSRGGGFVFNTVHNIQARTPLNNILAMLNAINDFNGD